VKTLRALFACAALLLTTACTQIGITAANLPTHFDGNIKKTPDIAFSATPALALDIYSPANATQPLPVIVFFYGGRWTIGERAQYAFAGHALAQRGYVVVIPDYRKYPDVKFPAFVQDAASAVAWTHDNIAIYGGDASRLYVTGHSSGAHLGSLVATDPRYLTAHDMSRDIIRGFAGLAGPYAFIPEEPDLKDIFGPPENYPEVQAITFVDGRQPPMLLLWGAEDTAVGQFNMDNLAARIREKGGRYETKIYPGINHAWIVGALSWMGKNKAHVADDMDEFFKTQ
jgi:acetyl esterase/lipase